MYVEKLGSRIEGLEFLDAVGKGKHVALGKTHLEKVAALIIDPSSPGAYFIQTQILDLTRLALVRIDCLIKYNMHKRK